MQVVSLELTYLSSIVLQNFVRNKKWWQRERKTVGFYQSTRNTHNIRFILFHTIHHLLFSSTCSIMHINFIPKYNLLTLRGTITYFPSEENNLCIMIIIWKQNSWWWIEGVHLYSFLKVSLSNKIGSSRVFKHKLSARNYKNAVWNKVVFLRTQTIQTWTIRSEVQYTNHPSCLSRFFSPVAVSKESSVR